MTFGRTAVWRSTGLMIACDQIDDTGIGSRLLRIEDLNPEVKTQNVLTRWELARMGMWMIARAISASPRKAE